jgi:hypothetical protein
MIHDPGNTLAAASPSDTKLRSLLGGLSVFTMVMTVPQVWAIWVGQQASGGFDPIVEYVSSFRRSLVMVRNSEA